MEGEASAIEYDDVELMLIELDERNPHRQVRVEKRMELPERMVVTTIFRSNVDVFAWSPEDIVAIDPRVVVHPTSFGIVLK